MPHVTIALAALPLHFAFSVPCALALRGSALPAWLQAPPAPALQEPRALIQGGAGNDVAPRDFDHAVMISVDGLRSDALLALPAKELPAMARLRACASTLNARTDPDFTVTLPNHTAMLTGRATLGEEGHGWTENVDPPQGATLHGNRGGYVASVFDVAHDRGLRTALFAGKTKFSLYDVSWDGEHGASDTVGSDEGRDKIDEYLCADGPSEIADAALRFLGEGRARCLVFAHFAVTDHAGHAAGWDLTPGSPYLRAVAVVDREIGRILDGIRAREGLRQRTVVVLTADHGGGAPFRSHDQPRMWVDYIVPFLVWTGEGSEDALGRELYSLNAGTRADPGITQPAFLDRKSGPASAPPPIRNGDAANLTLGLLGLPPVPGSTINARQDLSVVPAR